MFSNLVERTRFFLPVSRIFKCDCPAIFGCLLPLSWLNAPWFSASFVVGDMASGNLPSRAYTFCTLVTPLSESR